jgi:hypothetical protein
MVLCHSFNIGFPGLISGCAITPNMISITIISRSIGMIAITHDQAANTMITLEIPLLQHC